MTSAFQKFRPEELLIAAMTIWGEARGESKAGQQAVGHVILNRWKAKSRRFGYGLAAVCQKPWQFSCWNEDDPNRDKLRGLELSRNRVLRICMVSLLEAMNATTDPTNGATHYHSANISAPWAQGKVACAIIGHHLFYNDID